MCHFLKYYHFFGRNRIWFDPMKNSFVIYITLFSFLLPGCGKISTSMRGGTSQEKDYPKDSWYHTGMPSVEPWDWNKINSSEIYEINDAAKPKAEYLLRQKPVVQLSSSQVDALLSQNFTSADLSGKAPYLVRALYFNKETGGFKVYFKEKTIWVEHGSLGSDPVPMKRQSLIVLLKVRPDKVFVTCSMDE